MIFLRYCFFLKKKKKITTATIYVVGTHSKHLDGAHSEYTQHMFL